MITFYYWAIELADNFDAFAGICVVTNHVAEADKVRAPASTRVGHYSFQRLKIRVNVTENCEPHWSRLKE